MLATTASVTVFNISQTLDEARSVRRQQLLTSAVVSTQTNRKGKKIGGTAALHSISSLPAICCVADWQLGELSAMHVPQIIIIIRRRKKGLINL